MAPADGWQRAVDPAVHFARMRVQIRARRREDAIVAQGRALQGVSVCEQRPPSFLMGADDELMPAMSSLRAAMSRGSTLSRRKKQEEINELGRAVVVVIDIPRSVSMDRSELYTLLECIKDGSFVSTKYTVQDGDGEARQAAARIRVQWPELERVVTSYGRGYSQ